MQNKLRIDNVSERRRGHEVQMTLCVEEKPVVARMDVRAAFEEINRRHRVSRAYFFSQKDFRRQFKIDIPIGLCAGLVQVWWSELRKGNDAIRCLQEATPKLIGDVLLSQARSFYLQEFPPLNRDLRAAEVKLLEFKYGEHRVSLIESLYRLFGVSNCLELDLALLHGLPVIKKWDFSHLASDIVKALTESPRPGLYVFLIRFWHRKQASRERGHRGHRIALVIEPAGSCRFYDPRRGEMSFSAFDQFTAWFTDYWTTEGWGYYLQRGFPPPVPVQLFALGDRLSPAAMEKSMALQSRFSSSSLNVEELTLWLDGLRSCEEVGHSRDSE
jgi:ribosomal protein L21